MSEGNNPKLPLREVDSSDCEVSLGREIKDGKVTNEGTPYRIHEGEKVWVLPVNNLRESLALAHFGAFDNEGSDDDRRESMLALERSLDDICSQLSKRVVKWDWTDMMGEPLPQPYRNPQVFHDLTEDEILWLVATARGESPGERKNGSTPSGNTSGAARNRATRRST